MSVKKVDHEPVITLEMSEHGTRFGAGKDDRQPGWAPDALELGDKAELSLEHLLVKEK